MFLGAFDKRATLSDTKSGLCADRTPCTRDDECGSADFCDRTVPTKDATFILTSNLGQAHATLCSWLRSRSFGQAFESSAKLSGKLSEANRAVGSAGAEVVMEQAAA